MCLLASLFAGSKVASVTNIYRQRRMRNPFSFTVPKCGFASSVSFWRFQQTTVFRYENSSASCPHFAWTDFLHLWAERIFALYSRRGATWPGWPVHDRNVCVTLL